MLPWEKLQKNLNKLKNGGLDSIIKTAIENNSRKVTKLNTDDQLFDKGVDSSGSKISPAYSRTTVSIKNRKGQPTNRVTLKDTGSFHKSFKVDTKKESFKIDATDSKRDKLVKKYSSSGENIFGLTDFSLVKLSHELSKEVLTSIKMKI